jgi:O-antigen ligase
VRIFFLVASAAAFVIGMKTGSRGGLLSIMILAALLLWKASGAARVAIITTLIAGIIAAPFVLTDELKARYMTAFMGNDYVGTLSGDAAVAAGSALLSTEARTELMENALRLSLHHPLFGVGFGQFQVADAQRASDAGEEAYWHAVHNGFLVILVEDGLPALVAIVLAFGYAYFLVFRIYNRAKKGAGSEDHDIARMALCLLASLTTYFVCLNFSPGVYGVQMPFLAGFAAAFEMIVRKYRENQAVEAKAAATTSKLSLPVSPLAKARRKTPAWRP